MAHLFFTRFFLFSSNHNFISRFHYFYLPVNIEYVVHYMGVSTYLCPDQMDV